MADPINPQELSYDAWGNRRDADSWEVYTTLPAGILLARGFTGHEHIDLFDLINMDGRIYDPVVGRFISPDPIIQNPENLQSLNRYTYCLNNPLSLTDPSGYSWLSDNWKSLVVAAVSIAAATISFGAATPEIAAMWSGAAGGFAGGFTGAVLSGANIGQAFTAGIVGGLIGAASGVLNFASGSVDATSKIGAMFERATKHAITNAWLNGVTGGDVEHGFIMGALSSLGNGLIDNNVSGLISKIAASAALGGSVEEIGGGKFSNGAITEAYGMLFNEMMHNDEEGDPPGSNNPSGQGDKGAKAGGKPSYTPPPKELPGFPDAERIKSKGGRPRWKLPDGDIVEWDGQHGEVERYNPRGKHKGAWDPDGNQIKYPVPGRKIDPYWIPNMPTINKTMIQRSLWITVGAAACAAVVEYSPYLLLLAL